MRSVSKNILVIVVLVLVGPALAMAAGTDPGLQEETGALSGSTVRDLAIQSSPVLEFGMTYQGAISQPNERDSYVVTLQANDFLYIRMNSGWSLWPNIRIYNPDMTLLDQTSTQQDRNELVVCAPTTGSYTVLIGDWEGDDTGSYTFYLQRLNDPGLPTAILPAQTIVSDLVQHSEFDTYTFQAQPNDRFLVRMNSNWSLWPHIRVYRPNGTLLDLTLTQQDRNELTVQAATAGIYTMLIGDWEGDDIGNYSMFFQRLNNPGSAAAILPGETLTSTIAQYSAFDTYTFQAQPNDRFLVHMNSNWSLWPHIRVYRPNGTLLDLTLTQQDRNELTVQAATAGTYTMLIGDWEGDDAGEYSLYFQRLNAPAGYQILQSGQTVMGSIDGRSEFDTYIINPLSGTNVLLTMSTSWPLWPHIRVYRPNGTLLGQTSTVRDYNELTVLAPTNGTYTVLVGDWEGTDTGNYSLYAQYHQALLSVVAVPGSSLVPTDTDGDGRYEDVNGNGRKDFADVVLFFNQMSWIAANEPLAAFDFNGNGRIDFADVTRLFNHL
jgi:PKD repeat protein